ncbi:unnamed protein product [Brassicogethes aeneus]|uniref:Uncharacterized protein n=1 Tax=Brassicogethes aeneus TaxID=1431903 RepID=A0A9P0BD21_BRAAE|nr:unnamed protein product [Brassicogethes aeneus]
MSKGALIGLKDGKAKLLLKAVKDKKQKVDDQWRLCCQLINNFDDDLKNESLIDKYWNKIMLFTDLSGQNVFKDLSEFVLDVLEQNTSRGTLESPEKKVQSRWRQQNIDNRKRVKAKKRRNLGHSYENWKGRKTEARTLGPQCHCKNKCRSLILLGDVQLDANDVLVDEDNIEHLDEETEHYLI